MTKILLNGYKMNDAIAILNEAIVDGARRNFSVQCENCTISIVTENQFGNNRNTIEVALRSADDSAWIPLDLGGYTESRPIINALPLICFPAFISSFKKLEKDFFADVWDAWDTISCYM